ncbi:MAG: CDP-glycerol glycerophosphotransferase family protein [Bacteroidia bacterium]|jgi:hypothetical protein|nr:CDP-glycerol glycerophosphotransferase family protein [Bacteroidia bacterium]
MNNLDKTYLNYYQSLKDGQASNHFLKIHFINVLRNYLVLLGREDAFALKIPLKIHIRSVIEVFISVFSLLKTLWKLRNKKSTILVLVNEPTHFKQVMGMKDYLDNHHPIFITSKRMYLTILKDEYRTSNVIFLPTFFIKHNKMSFDDFKDLFLKHRIEADNKKLQSMHLISTMQWYNFVYIKWIILKLNKVNQFKLCLVFNDLTTTGRMLSMALKENTSCKTVYVMHGLLSDECIESFHIADYYFLFGDYTRPILAAHQISEHQMYTIGTPYLEQFVRHPISGLVKGKVLPSISTDKKIVLVLLSGRGHTTSSAHHDKIIQTLHQTIKDKKEKYFFVFKLHKKDYDTYYKNLLDDVSIKDNLAIYPYEYFQGKDIIFEWIDIAHIIITGASTSALEAMYLNKPVITIDLMQEYENETQYIRKGGTYHCTQAYELNQYLDLLFTNGFKVKPEGISLAETYFSNPTQLHYFFFKKFPEFLQ